MACFSPIHLHRWRKYLCYLFTTCWILSRSVSYQAVGYWLTIIVTIIRTASIFIDSTSAKTYNLYMPKIAWVVAAGYPHHITQRGNYQQKIFSDDTDRRKYLFLLKVESNCYHLIILVYCLMSNQLHFMAIPQSEDSLNQKNGRNL